MCTAGFRLYSYQGVCPFIPQCSYYIHEWKRHTHRTSAENQNHDRTSGELVRPICALGCLSVFLWGIMMHDHDDSGPRIENGGPRTEDQGPMTKDRGPRTKDRGPRTENQGPSTEHQGLKIKDKGHGRGNVQGGTLFIWSTGLWSVDKIIVSPFLRFLLIALCRTKE